jgi:hypothetical protein
MRKINVNDGLDPNNPAHQLLIEINNRNEEMYGKYHSKCGLFEFFCHCKKEKLGNEQSR